MSGIEGLSNTSDEHSRATEYFGLERELQAVARQKYTRAVEESLTSAREEFYKETCPEGQAIYPDDPEYVALAKPTTEE